MYSIRSCSAASRRGSLSGHRPLAAYMTAFLESGLHLTFFSEPEPMSGDASHQERFQRVPWFAVLEWRRPAQFNVGDPSNDGDPQINFFAEPG
jgi:hypothetical protein